MKDIHDAIDSVKMRRDAPEGIKWTCCGEEGTTE